MSAGDTHPHAASVPSPVPAQCLMSARAAPSSWGVRALRVRHCGTDTRRLVVRCGPPIQYRHLGAALGAPIPLPCRIQGCADLRPGLE